MMSAKIFTTLMTVMLLSAGLSPEVDANEDKTAGWMTDVVSETGTGLVLQWYNTFSAQLNELDQRLDDVESSISYAEQLAPTLQQVMDDSLVNVTTKLADANTLLGSMNLPPPPNDTFVAFATGEGSVSYDASSTDTIKLQPPVVNTQHYDHDTGTFTAPRDGLYWFLLRATPASSIHIDMLRNGVDQLTQSSNSGYYDVKLRTAITFLAAGDTVALFSAGSSGTKTLNSGLFFSGMLLSANNKLTPDFLVAS